MEKNVTRRRTLKIKKISTVTCLCPKANLLERKMVTPTKEPDIITIFGYPSGHLLGYFVRMTVVK